MKFYKKIGVNRTKQIFFFGGGGEAVGEPSTLSLYFMIMKNRNDYMGDYFQFFPSL